MELKKKLKQLLVLKKLNMAKDFKKIRFEYNDGLPMNKTIKLLLLTIIIRCHDLLTMARSLKNIAILSAKGNTFRCLLRGISKHKA